MLSAVGRISVEPHKGRIVVNVSNDFSKYYSTFISKTYWLEVDLPLHKPHITIANSLQHKKINWNKAVHHHNKIVEFNYDNNLIQGGYRKGFIMFYLRVYSEELEALKQKLGIVEPDTYKGLHITIGNIGKAGATIRNWWPKMIEVME
jgi:hypothetical protein